MHHLGSFPGKPCDLAAAGGDARIGDIRIDRPDRRLDHTATVIDPGDDAVGAELVVNLDRSLGPIGRLILPAGVGQHIGVIVFGQLCLPIMPSERSADGDRRAK